MTPTSALELIRETLKRAKDNLPFTAESYEPALAALSVLEASVLPELPEGWALQELQRSHNYEGTPDGWRVTIFGTNSVYEKNKLNVAHGPTPRAAMLAALGRINEN